jgi:TolB-like protein/Tfp pilus assembly protein PilF
MFLWPPVIPTLTETPLKDPSPSVVRAQVDKIASSSLFGGSERLVVLLRFIVDETLSGRGAVLKEAVIGDAVYGRDPPYDPRIDSTVRVEMRRLRQKIKEYYTGEGKSDRVAIQLPTGRYTPRFTTMGTAPSPDAEEPGLEAIFAKGAGARLAILPFRSISTKPDDVSFAEGLTDELMFVMGRAPGFQLASRNATSRYGASFSPAATLAEELGVDAILHGSVRHEGDHIRVTIEVVDTKGFVVWSDRFDAPDADRMQLQEQIAAATLSRARIDHSRVRGMLERPTPAALAANAKIIRARQMLDLQTPAALLDAMKLFTEVSLSAPDYARGHAGVADCVCDLFRLGLIGRVEALETAGAAAAKALRADPESVEAHCALATIAAWLERDPIRAEAVFERAVALGPNARAARIYGVFLTILQRHEEAARLFREARAIEPFSTQQDIAEAISAFQARRFDEFLAAPVRKGDRRPAEALIFTSLAAVFGGEPERARSLIAEIEDGAAKLPNHRFLRAEIEAWLGEPSRAARLTTTGGPAAPHFPMATLAAARGDEAGCLAALEAAVESRELSTAWLATDIRFDAFRGAPRFMEALARVRPDLQ